MQVRLLGPVDVMVDGDPRPVRGLRRKAVLAVLALRGGEIVSTDQLADAVWGQDAPSTAVNTLQKPHVVPADGAGGQGRDPGPAPRLPAGLVRRRHRCAGSRAAAAPGPAVARTGRGGAGPAPGAEPVAGAAAGGCDRGGLAGRAGRAAGPVVAAGQAGTVRGQAGGGGTCPARAGTGADRGRS